MLKKAYANMISLERALHNIWKIALVFFSMKVYLSILAFILKNNKKDIPFIF